MNLKMTGVHSEGDEPTTVTEVKFFALITDNTLQMVEIRTALRTAGVHNGFLLALREQGYD